MWGVAFAQNWYHARELEAIAERLEIENREHLSRVVSRPVEATSVVTAAMEHVVYGQAFGKIAIYMVHKDGAGRAVYQGIEYHYEKEASTWKMVDSAACTTEDSWEAARSAFGHDL